MFKKLIIGSLIVSLSLGCYAHTVFADSVSDSAAKAADYLLSQQAGDGNIGGVGFSGWALQSLAATGRSSSSTLTYLENNIGAIESQVPTDFERTILSIVAAGRNPRSFAGKDLVALLKSKAQGGQIGLPGLLNDDSFGVLALLASGEPGSDPLVTSTAQYLASQQQADGSFSWSRSGVGDSNNTAASVEALEFAKQKGVAVSYNISAAINYLKLSQNSDGGFGYQPGQASDGSSTSWVIHAINALGQTPESWVKDGKNPFTFLQSLQQANGGVSWQPGGEADIITTTYATIAFARKALPVAVIMIVPSPSPSPVVAPSPTPTPLPSPIPSPTPATSPSPSPIPSQTPSPNPSIVPTPSPSPRVSSLPSPSPVLSPSAEPSVAPSPSPAPSPSMVLSPSPSPQATPSPASTPLPSVSPTPEPSSAPSMLPTPSPEVRPTPSPQLSPVASPTPTSSPFSSPSPIVSSVLATSTPDSPFFSATKLATTAEKLSQMINVTSNTAQSNKSLSNTTEVNNQILDAPEETVSPSPSPTSAPSPLVQSATNVQEGNRRMLIGAILFWLGAILVGVGIISYTKQHKV